ncbi:Multiple ankyrin repeats single kh domain [Mycena venus]|uniref:Multiple ankyrin repeats single kh domain n=1 Tax=Mycena venus TaxID=2733690 RepID=A0A8H6XCU0_9AGAR|nr:Multiple ankyrin repeats single kh domain [Mycena venus]
MTPCIPGDPDISGIGVRVAIYAQNLFSFIPAVSSLWDGEVAKYELEAVKAQSTTILITAFGILISAMVQAQTLGLSNFHATIILSLSWMNNTNTFIYFLLYVQHKSQLGPQQIRSDVISWYRHVRAWFSRSVKLADGGVDVEAQKNSSDPDIEPSSALQSNERSLFSAIFRVEIKGTVAILGSLHLSMMAALGIWLWSNPRSFGIENAANACGIQYSSTIILGKQIPLSSNTLRIFSLLLYAIFLAPGFNLLLPMSVFLGILLFYRTCHAPRRVGKFDPADRRKFDRSARHKFDRSGRRHPRPTRKSTVQSGPSKPAPKGLVNRSLFALQTWYNPFLLPTFVGMAFLFAVNVVFLIDIELTLRQNRKLQTSDESIWTFGQILAMLLLVLPLRDLRVFGARRDVTALLKNAVRWHASTEILWDLVRRGADVNVEVEGTSYPTVLLLAVSRRRDVELTRILLASGANPDIPDDTNGTALQAACSYANLKIVKLLLESGADPNIEGGEYGTALQAASYSGNLKIVELLLENGADVNIEGGRYGTALQAATSLGHADIVELLRIHGATS